MFPPALFLPSQRGALKADFHNIAWSGAGVARASAQLPLSLLLSVAFPWASCSAAFAHLGPCAEGLERSWLLSRSPLQGSWCRLTSLWHLPLLCRTSTQESWGRK